MATRDETEISVDDNLYAAMTGLINQAEQGERNGAPITFATWAAILLLGPLFAAINAFVKATGSAGIQLLMSATGPLRMEPPAWFAQYGGYIPWLRLARSMLPRNEGPSPSAPQNQGIPRELNAITMYTGDEGQKAELWMRDYQLVCTALSIDPMKFISLKMAHTNVNTRSTSSPRDVFEAALKRFGPTLTLTQVQEAMVKAFEVHTYDKSHAARDQLMAGSHSWRADDSLGTYITRFEGIMKDALNMAETDRNKWFINGLSTQMQGMCAVMPMTGGPWTNYDALVQYAYGQEVRLAPLAKLGVADTHDTKTATEPKKRQRHDGDGHNDDPHFGTEHEGGSKIPKQGQTGYRMPGFVKGVIDATRMGTRTCMLCGEEHNRASKCKPYIEADMQNCPYPGYGKRYK